MYNKSKNFSFLSLSEDSDNEYIQDPININNYECITQSYMTDIDIYDSNNDFKESETNSIIYNIIRYIENINSIYPVIIIDGENLIGGPVEHRTSKVKRVFNKYNDINKVIILVVKKSGGVRRFKNYTNVDVPNNYIFISLHADNKTCPDDGFILELSHRLVNAIVVTDDEFLNREYFNYGNMINGTKLTTNIGIEGRYIPDIDIINNSIINRRHINKRIIR